MATIYNKDLSKGVSLNQTQIDNLAMKPSNMCGFILREDIEDILALPGCEGIRFYNIVSTNPNFFGSGTGNHHLLIACGVDSEGYEINSRNLTVENNTDSDEINNEVIYITNPIFGAIHERIKPISHSKAVLTVKNVNFSEGKIQMLAFFSKSDLEGLLSNAPTVPDGLTLYIVQYLNQGEIGFNDDHLEEFKAWETFATMIAFRTKLVGNDLPLSPDFNGNIMSLYPCPGHCVWTNHDTQDRAENRLALHPNVDMDRRPNPNDPYLFDWTKTKDKTENTNNGFFWLPDGIIV